MRDASGRAYVRYNCTPPHMTMTGDLEAATLYAGTGWARSPTSDPCAS